MKKEITEYLSKIGKIGGASKSPAKVKAARENGAKNKPLPAADSDITLHKAIADVEKKS